MPLLDVFRKKKKESIAKPPETKVEKKIGKEEIKIEKPKDYNPPTTLPLKRAPIKIGETYRILKTPHITEKATDLTNQNQYIFKIYPRANKLEVKKAIENLYGVDVISVKIINIPPKRRRLGRIEGWRKGYKKAIIRIKEGQKIEVLPR